MTSTPVPVISCSSCGEAFVIPGRHHGFSHCEDHRIWTPLPKWKQQLLRDAGILSDTPDNLNHTDVTL
jgi:hypothetical protein